MERGYIRTALGGEVRAYATATTPIGILKGVMQALEYHGADLDALPANVDIKKLEQDFASINARDFERLLSVLEHIGLQIAIIEAHERTGKGVVSRLDPGTQLGRVA
ncbi:MAG: hypothetical protein EKK29_13785 [Hyphomicrobiales bacterium]|nr:MAG: hypothetical protein EKK29_13785 [Hyphomicrobiales bacterium]